MVFALLTHRAHVHGQVALLPERSISLRARVVSALLVHRAHMPTIVFGAIKHNEKKGSPSLDLLDARLRVLPSAMGAYLYDGNGL